MAIDPTKPADFVANPTLSNSAISLNSLTLNAVIIYPSYRIALINGQILMNGDHIGEYIVTNIELNTVELTGPQDKKIILNLVTSIKQKVSK
ncbi:MAG: hypothetical protein ACD_46C00080G0008 [uncultured bacterium]|nr:MAG: hypothetical protein ACD_46C00080G0008 [uncultured bacterium]